MTLTAAQFWTLLRLQSIRMVLHSCCQAFGGEKGDRGERERERGDRTQVQMKWEFDR